MGKIKNIFKNKRKSVDKKALLEERAKLVDRLNAITLETSLEDIMTLRKDWKSYLRTLEEQHLDDINSEYMLFLTHNQHDIFDTIINNQSKIYRTRRCSPNAKYNAEYGLWYRTDKGQKPVDVKKLNEHKERYAKYKADPKNSLESIRNRRLNDIIHWNSRRSKPSITGWDGFYNWLKWFCGHKYGRGSHWYHYDATQEMRDLEKMSPQTCDAHLCKFTNIDEDTLVLIKHSNKRKDYMDDEQWKNIINFIKEHNTRLLIKKIVFCKHIDYKYYDGVKIRDKEWKFIEDAGCSYVDDVETDMYIDENCSHHRNEKVVWKLKGKLFKINY